MLIAIPPPQSSTNPETPPSLFKHPKLCPIPDSEAALGPVYVSDIISVVATQPHCISSCKNYVVALYEAAYAGIGADIPALRALLVKILGANGQWVLLTPQELEPLVMYGLKFTGCVECCGVRLCGKNKLNLVSDYNPNIPPSVCTTSSDYSSSVTDIVTFPDCPVV
jgi:hypothetical protein